MKSFFAKTNLKIEKTKHPILKWAGRFFMTLGIFIFISILISAVSIFSLLGDSEKAKPLPNEFVLSHTLKGTLPEANELSPIMAQFLPPQLTLYSFLRSLEVAATDDRVSALVVKIDNGDYSMTQLQTIRKAIQNFKNSGKKTYAYSESFGGFSNGIGEYWLASAFDEIWVQPVGTVSLNGIRIEQPFFKNALDKIGVEFEMEARKDYKTGAEMYIRNSMSHENRETITSIVDTVMTTMMGDIQNSRQVDKEKLKSAIDNSPLTLDEAKKFGLIDHVGYVDELEDMLNGDDDPDDMFVGFQRYKSESVKRVAFVSGAPKVAIVNVDGAIVDADALASINHPMAFIMPDNIADATMISSTIHDASNISDIEVIILRVNSPGGSPSASEKIRRAIVKAKEKGKYVVVSMGEMAASGGYWVSVDANHIIASDLTITGSIGVYGGKPDLSGLWDKLGVSWGAVEYGQNAGMWSTNKDMSQTERKRLNIMMDKTYNQFTNRVERGRGMSGADVEKVAQGRAWMGVTASQNGLVDQLGGYKDALKFTATKIGIDDWKTMSFLVLPKREDSLRDIVGLLGFPSIKDTPKIPSVFIPAFYDNAIITTPMIDIDF